MPFKSFETMLKRNGLCLRFQLEPLQIDACRFYLEWSEDWDNEKTVYDLGTGVTPIFGEQELWGIIESG